MLRNEAAPDGIQQEGMRQDNTMSVRIFRGFSSFCFHHMQFISDCYVFNSHSEYF